MQPTEPRARRRWAAVLLILFPLGLAIFVPWHLNYPGAQENETLTVPVYIMDDLDHLPTSNARLTIPQGSAVALSGKEIAVEFQGKVKKIKGRAIDLSGLPRGAGAGTP
jgi:hypothetical protein